jgi:hypothetical protein
MSMICKQNVITQDRPVEENTMDIGYMLWFLRLMMPSDWGLVVFFRLQALN